MRVWVTGASGLLGNALLRVLRNQEIPFAGSLRRHADITNIDSIASFCREYGPFTHIINCAAYTAVDLAEAHPEEARRANALGPSLLGLFAAHANMRLVHVSTDYVFDGKGSRPYREDDPVVPETIYGQTKAEGERRLVALFPKACIVRASWLFGREGKSFVSAMVKKMTECAEVRVVSDQRGRPTFADDLALWLLKLANQSGIFHVANQGETTWYQFAEEIRNLYQTKCEKIIPVTTAEFGLPTKRPLYSVLDTEKVERMFEPLPSWKDRLRELLCDPLPIS